MKSEFVEDVPMEKFFGLASKRGFCCFLALLDAPKGAGAGFLPVLVVLGGWSLRQVQSASSDANIDSDEDDSEL